MAVTIYAHGNSDSLHGIFNGVAMVMGGNDYSDMVKIAVVIGFLTVGALAMAPTGMSKSWNWIISVAVLNSLLFVPRTEVVIVDRLNQHPTAVVGNVPWTLGVLGAVKSSIGSTLTGLFDTAFQTIPASDRALPSELGYMQTGVLFGNRLVKGSREAGIADPNGNADALNYMRSCVFPEVEYGNFASRMQRSTNLEELIANPNAAMIVAVHVGTDPATAVLRTMSCADAYPIIQSRLDGWANEAIRSLAAKSFPNRAIDDAITNTESALVAMYGQSRLMGAASTARDVMVQNILINATADAAALHAASLDDPAMITLGAARAQAISQMNAGFLTQGRIAEEALPLIRNVVEAIIYALFPIVCLMLMASEGQALKVQLKSYFLVLLWVEMWSPMFAIVNYLQTMASSANLGAAGVMTGAQGLSLETAGAVFGTAVSDLSVASWMVTFVPVIAAAALFGVDKLVSAIGGAKPGTAQADSAARQATQGSYAFGNLSMGQMNVSEHVTSPFVRSQTGIGGMTSSHALTGQRVDQYAESSALASLQDTAGWQRQASEQHGESLRRARQDSMAWTRSIDAGFDQLKTLARSGSKAAELGLSAEVGRVASEEAMRADIATSAEKISRTFGINDSSHVAKAIEASADGGLGVNAGLARITAGLRTTGRSQEAEQLENAVQRAGEQARSAQTQRKEALVSSFRNSNGFTTLARSDRQAADTISSSLREGHNFREQATESLDRARSFELAERKIAAFGVQGVARWGNEIASFFRAHGEDPLKGVASTARQKDLLRQFILQGDLVGPNGSWMPDLGQGPNIPQDRLSFDQGSLRRDYADVPSDQFVPAVAASNDARVDVARSGAGVSPAMTVSGRSIKQTVTDAQGGTGVSIGAKEGELSAQRGTATADLAQRGARVSPQHTVPQLHGYNNDNPTAAEAKFGATPFAEERKTEEANRAQHAAGYQQRVDSIPKN
jgi:conjugal transfer mating pair stabilization protein TraG